MEYLSGKTVLCEGEYLIRKYRCFAAKKAAGGSALEMFVTNMRLILQTAGAPRNCRNMSYAEIAIAQVEGIKFHDNQTVEKQDNRKKLIALGLIYLILSAVTWAVAWLLGDRFPVLFGLPDIVTILLCYAIVCLPILYLLLRSVKERSTSLVIVCKNVRDFVAFTSCEHYDGSLKLAISADARTAEMLGEIGALIHDLKCMSEAEFSRKWQEPSQGRQARRAAAKQERRHAKASTAENDEYWNASEREEDLMEHQNATER